MDSVRSWVVGVARSVVCGYLYPKMVGLWGWIAGVRDIVIDGCRLLPLLGNPFQLYCNGVQWVTFKFNLKF